ncbi:FUSC family protein [Pseudochelatococcus sp. B33]
MFQWQSLADFARKEIGALIAVQRNDRAWQFPLAAAAACGMPMALGALLELPTFGALGAVAGLSFLYTPLAGSRHAIAIVLASALAMTASYALGLAGSIAPAAAPILIGCVAAAGFRFCQFNRLAPPGPLFMVIAAAIGAFSPVDAPTAAVSLGQFVIGCVWSCAVSVIYLAVISRPASQQPQPAVPHTTNGVTSSILTGLFVGSSVAVAAMLDLQKPYWAAVTCVAVMQGTTLRASLSRNIHRVSGTFIGLGVTGLLAPILTTSWSIAAAIAVLTFLVEATIVRHYAFAAIFFTPLAILLAESSNSVTMNTGALMQARLIDTIVGALIGLLGAVCMHSCQRRDRRRKDQL